MPRFTGFFVIFLTLISVAGCSSTRDGSSLSTGAAIPDVAAATTAGTDALPVDDGSNVRWALPKDGGDDRWAHVPVPNVGDHGPASSPNTAAKDLMVKYLVIKNDTLMKIAFTRYGDLYRWRDLYELNQGEIKNPNRIYPGETLLLKNPPLNPVIERNGEPYLIERGDTLCKISYHLYGSADHWRDLFENNRQTIHDPNLIFAGFNLYYLKDLATSRVPASSTQ